MRDYREHPLTVGEIRAQKDEDCRSWTPRDVLIETLRSIDNGEIDPKTLVVVFDRSQTDTGFTFATDDPVRAVGMVTRAVNEMAGKD